MTVWLNGRLVASAGALDAADRGFTLGDGLFETIRLDAGRPAHLARHLARLRHGAQVLDLPLPADDATIAAAIAALVEAGGLGGPGQARITLTRGPAPRGVLPPSRPVPSLLVTAGPAAAQAGPARLVLATVTRRNEWSPLARLKSLNYLDNILARQEAAACGADDAVLLNTAGRVAETSIANLFAVLDDALVTPPVADGALPGILRGLVIERLGAVARPLDPEDLTRARAIVLTNSLGARPVASLPGWQPDPTAPDLARHILETCR